MKIIRNADLTFVPASHEDPAKPGCYKKVLFTRDDLREGRVQMVNWSKMPVGGTFQNHYHESLAEVFVITKGSVRGFVNTIPVELHEGDGLYVEAGEKHTLTNISVGEVFYVVFGIVNGEGKTVVV